MSHRPKDSHPQKSTYPLGTGSITVFPSLNVPVPKRVLNGLSHGRPVGVADFVGAAVDAAGETLFALTADRALYAWEIATGELRTERVENAVAAGDAVGITCHPTKAGVVAVWGTDAIMAVFESHRA